MSQEYEYSKPIVASSLLRYALIFAGTGFVGLGVIGIVVPGLPTTPFLLLAATCYARSSQRFYNWLLSNRSFGPTIRQWREHRSIPPRSKFWAMALTTLSFGVTIVFFAPYVWVKFLLLGMCLLALGVMWRLPTRVLSS